VPDPTAQVTFPEGYSRIQYRNTPWPGRADLVGHMLRYKVYMYLYLAPRVRLRDP